MSAGTSGGTPQPSLGTMTVLYDEARRSVDQQIATIGALNGRASQLLGFSVVIISVIAALGPQGDASGWVKALSFASLTLFAVVASLGFIAWRFHTYRDDPDPEALYRAYRGVPEAAVRDQVIGNRFDVIRTNTESIRSQETLVKWAARILVVAFVVLSALVVVQLMSSEPAASSRDRGQHHRGYHHGS